MKRIKDIFNAWVVRFKSETPAFWNFIKAVFGYVPIIYSVLNSATAGAVAPTWYTNSQWYMTGGAGLIFFIAQSQTKKEDSK